ncbi:EF-hand calcium-binding domain-containing protein 6 [Elysia marginata]|uniref:EF-hand calcium-binding domain-containing protein 6 n=1 Tax=Elysia marginata TaxID=1093978 RepID=A0AAV4GP66_9GAST|nr:EF-hand calcium-binding domain-containing protein 6 [Elysia marginata]
MWRRGLKVDSATMDPTGLGFVSSLDRSAFSHTERFRAVEDLTHTTKVSRSQTGPVTVSKVDTVEICGNRAEVISQQGQLRSGPPRDDHRGTVSRSTKEKRKEVQEEETTTTTTTTTRKKTTTTTTKTKTTTENGGGRLVDDDKLAGHVRALISSKRAAPEFDSLLDNLNYKLEDTYRNLQSAFRLFDFMGDGYVAKIDFRRVLKEFGFDIPAVDLDAFLGRAGISVVQGLVNYKQFLYKFQSRGSSSVFNKCLLRDSDDFNQGGQRIETEEMLRAENMESGVSSFFHADYVKLLNMLKQKDKRNTGTVPASELRSAVNAVLKTNMSDAQFGELLARLTVSADFNNNSKSVGGPAIQYKSLLDLLNSEPERWNQRKDGHWTVLKYQLGDVAPASPVLRLQEKAKTWMAPPPERYKEANSRVVEIRKELTKLFTDRFHTFDKNFKDMDRRKSGYMSKWQFGALVKLCGITLSVKDLDFLWATLDTAADNTLSYVTLVKTFTGTNQQQQQQQQQKTYSNQARPVSASLLRQGITGSKAFPTGEEKATHVVTVEQPHVIPGSAKEGRLVELLKKIRDDVLEHWEEMYSQFLRLDRDGHASIAVQDMKDIMYKMKLPLSGPQRTELCNMFDLRANGWFHYVSFLQAIKKHTPGEHISPCVFDIHTKRLHRKAGPTSQALTVFDFLLELKNLLLKKHKTLRSSFKVFDQNRSGYIEETELRSSLSQLGYALSDQDFLDVLQVLDGSQAQRISFDDFKTVLLTL